MGQNISSIRSRSSMGQNINKMKPLRIQIWDNIEFQSFKFMNKQLFHLTKNKIRSKIGNSTTGIVNIMIDCIWDDLWNKKIKKYNEK